MNMSRIFKNNMHRYRKAEINTEQDAERHNKGDRKTHSKKGIEQMRTCYRHENNANRNEDTTRQNTQTNGQTLR